MHELSIAEALMEQVRRHTPSGYRVILARVEAGAYQSIDPQALDMAWEALTSDTDMAGIQLETQVLPYQLSCPQCGCQWSSSDPFDVCNCGAEARCSGTSELRLLSLEIESREAGADLNSRLQEVDHAC